MVVISAQIASYFVLLWYFQETLESDVIYHFWDEFLSSKVAWFGCFFIVSSLWTIDYMLYAMRLCFRNCSSSDDAIDAEIKELEAKQTPAGSLAQIIERRSSRKQ